MYKKIKIDSSNWSGREEQVSPVIADAVVEKCCFTPLTSGIGVAPTSGVK